MVHYSNDGEKRREWYACPRFYTIA